PNTSPFAISVGATTNNVHLQYSAFTNITRFGPSAAAYDDVAEFSSRGPGIFGDPKPELMAVGSYGFTPADVTVKILQAKKNDANNDGAFALFGGTSMAAPMVAGTAALVVGDMKGRGEPVNPFEVKSRLMSTAKDLKNDPFVQGSGRVDALTAIELGRGKAGRFSAYTESTVRNVLLALSPALQSYNSTLAIIDSGYPTVPASLPSVIGAEHPESRWFAGHVEQGDISKTRIVVENPSKKDLKVEVSSTIEKLVARYEIQNSTALFAVDSTHSDKKYGYAPTYHDIKEIAGELPDSDLMVARVNFPFNSFLNSTELFADHLRIASIYAYDWHDSNGDRKVAFGETTMINRGGSWGTTQEVRVGDPVAKFKGTPVVGVYPVPTVFSFWRGDRLINSTSMNYTLTIEFYKRLPNPDVLLDRAQLTVPAEGKASVGATAIARGSALPGIYYGEILFKGPKHSILMPVSYIVTTKPVPKDVPVVISPGKMYGPEIEASLGLRPNGYVGGLSDMLSRYSAGDWRSYYFSVKDPTITSMSVKASWPHNSTSINAMAFGPDGRLVASSVPAGVFQEFAGWASNDWLGTSAVSEGGAFFFSQNSGGNSTTLYVPVNQTGIYAVLMHNTLFHGESLYEPVTVEAKFSTLLPDSTPPRIALDLPRHVGGRLSVPVEIDDANPAGFSYSIDGRPVPLAGSDLLLDGAGLAEGPHLLTVESADTVGHRSMFASEFIVDRTPPFADISILYENGTRAPASEDIYLARGSALLWNVTDANGVLATRVRLPGANATDAQHEFRPDLADGQYALAIASADEAGNKLEREWKLVMDSTAPAAAMRFSGGEIKGTAKVEIDVKDANAKSALLVIGHKAVDVTGMKEYQLDTAGLADGRYEAKLVALDAAGNAGTATAAVVVANVMPLVGIATALGIAGGLVAGAAVAWTVAKRRSGKS
ncbi:MAG: S8 family serine peptidase, partial [Nitrososphaera sp.]|uniref:S8 family serine peptidase n=1 Tax=Nitrososphaera sp. TaxID=1971748 RepID=UPI003D6E90F4